MKNPLTAFFLSFIPGTGHIYLDKKFRGFLYLAGFIFPIVFGLFLTVQTYDDAPFVSGLIFAFLIGLINMIDMVVTLIKYKPSDSLTAIRPEQQLDQAHKQPLQWNEHNQQGEVGTPTDEQSFITILLAFIPGLGHFHLGLMNRGLTFLIGSFGLTTMVIFVTSVTNQGGFAAFLGVLPIIWIYNMFDITQLLARKRRGEELVDQTVLEDFEDTRQEKGKKSKALASILSIFPGAGHMYLGLQKRGFQLMAAFLLSIYILDVLRLSIFLFLIPLIWFYSFFDALQKVSKHGEEEQQDIPIVSYLLNHQKWLGVGLLLMGLYYLLDNILIPTFRASISEFFGVDIARWYYDYFQMAIICILLIGGGLKLLWGSKVKK